MATLLALVTFGVVVGIIVTIALLSRGGAREEVVRRRLAAVEKAQRRGSSSIGLDLVRDQLYSEVPQLQQLMMRWSWPARLSQYIGQAGMKIRPGKLLILSGISALAAYLVCGRLALFSFAFAPLAAVAAAWLPFGVVAIKRRIRLRAFERNFPDAIDLLGRAVRAGHAFTTGLEMISKELPQPVAGEFRTAFEEQNFGLPLKDALLNLSERVPLIDVRFFVTALLIQKETGGNLAEILDNLARVVRERFKIQGEVRIRTAQGRLTAGILIALPPTVGVLISILNPTYMRPLITEPLGHYMIATAVVMQILGSLMLWKIVHIEV